MRLSRAPRLSAAVGMSAWVDVSVCGCVCVCVCVSYSGCVCVCEIVTVRGCKRTFAFVLYSTVYSTVQYVCAACLRVVGGGAAQCSLRLACQPERSRGEGCWPGGVSVAAAEKVRAVWFVSFWCGLHVGMTGRVAWKRSPRRRHQLAASTFRAL